MTSRARRRPPLCVGILVALAASAGQAQEVDSAADSRPAGARPRVALVLSGGGARGAAHVGVLQVLEDLRIPVDYVVGTSMGAVVGGLYASGMPPEQLANEIQVVDWGDLFSDRAPRRNESFRQKQDDLLSFFDFQIGIGRDGVQLPTGLIAGNKLSFFLRTQTLQAAGVDNFDDLSIPFRAVATDLATGDLVILAAGDLPRAIRASMAVPGAFTPVEIDGRTLVDGGLVQNMPVDVARTLGVDHVIAVDVSAPLDSFKRPTSLFGVGFQTLMVLTDKNVHEQRERIGPGDVLILPGLGDIRSTQFDRMVEAAEIGESAARAVAPALRRFSVSEEEFARYLARRRIRSTPFRVDEIEVTGLDRVSPKRVLRRLRTQPGETLDVEVLAGDLRRIQQMGVFEHVDFQLHRGDRNRLEFRAREKSWGPNYLRFGLKMEANFEGRGDFAVLANYTRENINRYGADWRNIASIGGVDSILSEFYQPLQYSGFFFLSPAIEMFRARQKLFLPNGFSAEFLNDWRVGRFDAGVQFRNYGELRVGVFRGTVETDFDAPALTPMEEDAGGVRIRGVVDQLDNTGFPREGTFALLSARLSRTSIGASVDYDRLSVRFAQFGSFGENTLGGRVRVGTDLGSDLPLYDDFTLGGFLNLSAFERDRLRGQILGYTSLMYYRRLARLPRALGRGVYAGAAIEAGNTWQSAGDVDLGTLLPVAVVFGGVDSLLGPVYVAYAWGDGGASSFYLYVGRPIW